MEFTVPPQRLTAPAG